MPKRYLYAPYQTHLKAYNSPYKNISNHQHITKYKTYQINNNCSER